MGKIVIKFLQGSVVTQTMIGGLTDRQIVCLRSTDAQQIWRQKLCCRRATSLEQPPSTLARRRHQL